MVQLSHLYMTIGKMIALTKKTFVGKVMSLLFNTLFRFVRAFLQRRECLNFMTAVTIRSDFEAWENKICHCFHCLPIYFPWSSGTGCHDFHFFFFLILSFKLALSLSSLIFIKRLFISCLVSCIRVILLAYLMLLIFLLAILISVCYSSSPAFHMMYFA